MQIVQYLTYASKFYRDCVIITLERCNTVDQSRCPLRPLCMAFRSAEHRKRQGSRGDAEKDQQPLNLIDPSPLDYRVVAESFSASPGEPSDPVIGVSIMVTAVHGKLDH